MAGMAVQDPFQVVIDGAKVGYEVESWALRKYRINDPFTFRRALDDNIYEFLETDRGYIPDQSIEDLRLGIMFISLWFGVFAHFTSTPFSEMKLQLLLYILAYYSCVGICFLIATRLEGDHLLVSKARRTTAIPRGKKGLGAILLAHLGAIVGFAKGLFFIKRKEKDVEQLQYRIRFRSSADRYAPIYRIQAEIVQKDNHRWKQPVVLAKVEEDWSVGLFFDSEGYIYPPALKVRVDDLIKKVVGENDKVKGKTKRTK